MSSTEKPAQVVELDPEVRDARDRELYEGKNFDTMYYPQGIIYFYPDAAHPALKVKFKHQERCVYCNQLSPPLRHIEGWPYACVPCMKLRGFGGATKEVFFPEEIVMVIMCYCPTFHDMANLAKVCKRFLNAFNYGTSSQCDIQDVKRILLGRELYYLQRHPDEKRKQLASQKENQLQLAILLGEWLDANALRRIHLCRSIVLSNFYASQFSIDGKRFGGSASVAKDKEGNPVSLKADGMTIEVPKKEGDPYVATFDDPLNLTLFISPHTGTVESYSKKKKFRCAIQ
jgi:hypothetical protein